MCLVCSIRALHICMCILYFGAMFQDFTYYTYSNFAPYIAVYALSYKLMSISSFSSSSQISSTQLAIIMALCSMLLPPYYSQNYAGIIISSLVSYILNLILALFQIVLIITIFNSLKYFQGNYAIIDATAASPVPATKSKHIVNIKLIMSDGYL